MSKADRADDSRQKMSDDAWRARWNEVGRAPSAMAHALGVDIRNIFLKRNAILLRHPDWDDLRTAGTARQSPEPGAPKVMQPWPIARCVEIGDLCGKSILAGSDLHTWPGEPPVMWNAFCAVAHEIQPEIIVLVGDVIDGARVSRHPRTPNVNTPKITEELDQARTWMSWLPAVKRRFWVVGNHDIRVDTYLANMAPELDDYAGRLADRFSDWEFAWALIANETVEFRHFHKGGIYAARNNTIDAGISIVTGHTHKCQVIPHQDRRGLRWGVELGMLGDPDHPAFMYGLGAPNQHRPGFAVLTFDQDGELMPPELCEWKDGRAFFRGRVYADARGARVRRRAGGGD